MERTESLTAKVLEFFRTVSGLVVVAAVCVLTLGSSRLSDAAVADQSPARAGVVGEVPTEPLAETATLSSTASTFPSTALKVSYLVETPEQAATADWKEATAVTEARFAGLIPNWTHQVLYVRDPAEAGEARKAVFAHLLDNGADGVVQVVDMRESEDYD